MIEYVKLFREGDTTIPARLNLLVQQRQALLDQRKQIDATIARLNYKISKYEVAVETGVLSWEKENQPLNNDAIPFCFFSVFTFSKSTSTTTE